MFTHTALIGTPNMLWLLATAGRRLRKRTAGEGGPMARARRSQNVSCTMGVLDCPLSGSAAMGDVADRGGSQDEGMDER